jgi:hypothetical protein
MNIRDEEQLQQYFERGMSAAEEQNFLINVAARDDMRLAFRSQLELLKAVREDKDSSGSPTFVRTKTLTALGLGAALVPSSLKQQETETASLSPSILKKFGSTLRRPAISLTTGLLVGILGTSFLVTGTANEPLKPSAPAITAPAVQNAPQVAAPVTTEPVENKTSKSHVSSKTDLTRQTNTTENPTPIINQSAPGKVKVHNTVNKPDDSGK